VSGSVLLRVAPTPGLLFFQEQLLAAHCLAKSASLCKYAAGLLNGDSAAAEDCVQTVYLRVWGAMQGGWPIDNLGGFIRRAVRNECFDERIRREARPPPSGDPDRLERLPARGDGTVDADIKVDPAVLFGALNELCKEDREVLTLKAQGLSYRAIADRQLTTYNEVARRIRRARIKVRRRLGPLVAREGACFGRAG